MGRSRAVHTAQAVATGALKHVFPAGISLGRRVRRDPDVVLQETGALRRPVVRIEQQLRVIGDEDLVRHGIADFVRLRSRSSTRNFDGSCPVLSPAAFSVAAIVGSTT